MVREDCVELSFTSIYHLLTFYMSHLTLKLKCPVRECVPVTYPVCVTSQLDYF